MEISNYKVECMAREAEQVGSKSEAEYYHDVAANAVSSLFGAYWYMYMGLGHSEDEADMLAEDTVCKECDISPYQFEDFMHGEDEATAYEDYKHNL